LSSKIQNLNPRFFRIDYKLSGMDSDLESNNAEYTAIDISKSIRDFVESLEVQHKDEIVNYLDNLYTKLT